MQTSGFGSQQIAQNTPHIQRVESGPPPTSVEITYKPNPVYTDEARSLKMEGEVLLEVEFLASGQLHVNRVVRGLGHGLDEAAISGRQQDALQARHAKRAGNGFDSNCARGLSTGVLRTLEMRVMREIYA